VSTDRNNEISDNRTAWFLTLEVARRNNDFRRAAEAQEQLQRLGVRVRYLRRGRGDKRDE